MTWVGVLVKPSVFVAALMLMGGVARAEVQQIRLGPAPVWVKPSLLAPVPASPTGPLFVRRQDLEAHLGANGQAQYFGYRIKMLDSSALQLGNIQIAWDPAAGAPIVHQIKVFRGEDVIDALKDAKFEILQREDKLEAAMLQGTLTAVFRVPDLRVGDELEVDLTTFTTDPTMGSHATGLLSIAASPAPGGYHIGLGWDADHKPNVKLSPDLVAAAVTTDNSVDVTLDNPKVVSPPKDAPPRYQWQRFIQYSDFNDWSSLSRQLAPLYERAAQLAANSPLKAEAARIAAAEPTPMGRASAALKLVQQDVRYIYVGLNGGNLTPAAADETWKRRFGDCKAKTVLLLALLKELGLKGEAVLINSAGADDGLDQRLPMVQIFDHILVRLEIDGKRYWLDGTLPAVAIPSQQPIIPLNWVLPLSTDGRALERQPWQASSVPDEIQLYEIDARAGFDKPAHIVTTTITRGLKGVVEQAQLSTVSAAQLLDLYRQRGVGAVFQSIDDVQYRYDIKSSASILTVSGTGKVDWDDDGGGARSMALAGGGFNPPARRYRPPDQDQSAPFYQAPSYECYATTVRLPTSTQSGQWSSKPSFDQRFFGKHYFRAWELREGAVRMVSGSRVEEREIDASVAQRDNGRLSTFDNSMGYLFYNPRARHGSVGRGERVPATYESDWTAPDVPCLSSVPK